VIQIGFDVSVVADIFKFPYPLYPKYKHQCPFGFRYEIPDTLGVSHTYEYEINFPLNNDYELQSYTFSATGYKDQDNYNLIRNDQYVLKQIYTKELGHIKEIRPILKITPGKDTLKFVFNNVTGTSKVIWIDFDVTCRLPIKV
jgi:hypothetical protein